MTDPESQHRTLVVIPALNEEATLPAVLAKVREHVPRADVLIVNDGSRDNTVSVATQLGAAVVSHPYNLGYGGAIRTGINYGRRCGYERVVQFDADGQHDASEIAALLAPLDHGADMVVGSRFASGDGGYRPGVVRGVAMRALSAITRMLLGRTYTDTTSGFRALGPKAIAFLAAEQPTGFLSGVESLVLLSYTGARIDEVPVRMYQRAGGRPSARHIGLVYHYVEVVVVMLITASLDARRARRLHRRQAG